MTDPASDPTLQTVIDALARLPSLTVRKRADMTSAIYVFARALDRQPSEIPAKIDIVERLGRDLNAARLGITQGRLANVRSLGRRAMKLTGHTEDSPRLDFPLDPIWDQLADEGYEPELTDELKAKLDRRLASLDANPQDVTTWKAIVERVRRPR